MAGRRKPSAQGAAFGDRFATEWRGRLGAEIGLALVAGVAAFVLAAVAGAMAYPP